MEWKNKTLTHKFSAKAISTTFYILNRCLVNSTLKKTLYELWNGKKPNIGYFYPFACKCFGHNNGKENIGKFNPRRDEVMFMGYSYSKKAYRVFYKRTLCIKEFVHVISDCLICIF